MYFIIFSPLSLSFFDSKTHLHISAHIYSLKVQISLVVIRFSTPATGLTPAAVGKLDQWNYHQSNCQQWAQSNNKAAAMRQ